jgi:hypothetical protein
MYTKGQDKQFFWILHDSAQASMIGIIIHLFVILPVVDKLLKLENYSKPTKIAMVCAFLGAVAAGSAYYDHMNEPPNLYRIVDAKRGTTVSEMKKQYRTMAVKLHPDKVPDAQKAEAEKEFLRLKEAFDILSNDKLRDRYDRFGHSVLRTKGEGNPEFSGLVGMAVYYVLWFLLVFFIVSGKSSLAGRTWSYAGLAALFLVDAQTKFAELDFLNSIFPYNTPYEKIEFLKSCFPSFMSGCRVVSQAIFVDYESADRAALAQTLEHTRVILGHVMQILHNQVRSRLQHARCGGIQRSPSTYACTVFFPCSVLTRPGNGRKAQRRSPRSRRSGDDGPTPACAGDASRLRRLCAVGASTTTI